MVFKIPENAKKIYVNTGNILNLNEIKKLTGHNRADELVESLKITLATAEGVNDDGNSSIIQVSRNDGTVGEGNDAVGRESLKISVKCFIQSANPEELKDALTNVFSALNVTKLDSLVLACKLEPSAVLSGLQEIWAVVQELSESGSVADVGVSDIDTDVFVALYNWAKVKPRIIQINLAVCCVVPPILQEFCKDNNVQLLTHSDPLDILPRPALCQAFGLSDTNVVSLDWVVRYLTHIHYRGVLHSKGYLVSITKG